MDDLCWNPFASDCDVMWDAWVAVGTLALGAAAIWVARIERWGRERSEAAEAEVLARIIGMALERRREQLLLVESDLDPVDKSGGIILAMLLMDKHRIKPIAETIQQQPLGNFLALAGRLHVLPEYLLTRLHDAVASDDRLLRDAQALARESGRLDDERMSDELESFQMRYTSLVRSLERCRVICMNVSGRPEEGALGRWGRRLRVWRERKSAPRGHRTIADSAGALLHFRIAEPAWWEIGYRGPASAEKPRE